MNPVRQGRRRLILVGIAALAAAILGAALGSSHDNRTSGSAARPALTPPAGPGELAAARDAVRRMTLARQIGQVLVIAFRGTNPPAYVRSALRDGRAGGVVLFGQNVVSPSQLRRLSRSVRSASHGSALICVDQEGASIRIVRFAAPAVAPSRIRSTATARRAAAQTARDLRLYGINVNLAPVADVAAGAGPVMRSRAYAGGPATVASRVAAVVRVHGERGVAATAKHFPGFGAATANTDLRAAYVLRSRGAIERRDLPPFRAAIRAGVPLVMASHALYPALDPNRIASQSRPILRGLLRSRLGFRGAVITDSLEAKAVLSRSSVATAAVLSLHAGADIALLTGRGSFRPVYFRLLHEARHSRAFRARLVDAAARVRLLKQSLGLRAPHGT